jgi:hypothetical protein
MLGANEEFVQDNMQMILKDPAFKADPGERTGAS